VWEGALIVEEKGVSSFVFSLDWKKKRGERRSATVQRKKGQEKIFGPQKKAAAHLLQATEGETDINSAPTNQRESQHMYRQTGSFLSSCSVTFDFHTSKVFLPSKKISLPSCFSNFHKKKERRAELFVSLFLRTFYTVFDMSQHIHRFSLEPFATKISQLAPIQPKRKELDQISRLCASVCFPLHLCFLPSAGRTERTT